MVACTSATVPARTAATCGWVVAARATPTSRSESTVTLTDSGGTALPEPASTYKIKSLDVNAKLDGQVAKVQVSQSFVNTGSRQMEVSFVFPLPYDGAVDQLTLLIDGKEMPAKLLDARAARQLYEEIVRKNKDPALLEWMGTGLFKTSVFPVPPGAERKVTLR